MVNAECGSTATAKLHPEGILKSTVFAKAE
jgi:hypothetical protein